MSRIAMDTRAQNSWKELIEKEAATRIQCKLKQAAEAVGAGANNEDDEWFVRSKYTQSAGKTLHATRASTTGGDGNSNSNSLSSSVHQPIKYPERPARQDPAGNVARLTEELRASDKNLLSDMRPPRDDQTRLLFDGFTKEQKGRYQYLKARKSDNPEDKYEYPLVSSFEYGWKLREVAPAYKTPANGRSKIVEESFYRRNGVF